VRFRQQQWRKIGLYSDEQIKDLIIQDFQENESIFWRLLFEPEKDIMRTFSKQQGFFKVRVNGDVLDITLGMKLDRYKTHDIEIVVNRLVIEDTDDNEKR
jgi:excinuclease ABC subunit A